MAASTQKLDFGSAMGDFKNMFPHLDNKLIEKVIIHILSDPEQVVSFYFNFT